MEATVVQVNSSITSDRMRLYAIIGNLFGESVEYRQIYLTHKLTKRMVYSEDAKGVLSLIVSTLSAWLDDHNNFNKILKFNDAIHIYSDVESVKRMSTLIDLFLSVTRTEYFLMNNNYYLGELGDNMDFGSLGGCLNLYCSNMRNIIASEESYLQGMHKNSLEKQKEYLKDHLLPWAELFGEFVLKYGKARSVFTNLGMLPKLIFEADLDYINTSLNLEK